MMFVPGVPAAASTRRSRVSSPSASLSSTVVNATLFSATNTLPVPREVVAGERCGGTEIREVVGRRCGEVRVRRAFPLGCHRDAETGGRLRHPGRGPRHQHDLVPRAVLGERVGVVRERHRDLRPGRRHVADRLRRRRVVPRQRLQAHRQIAGARRVARKPELRNPQRGLGLARLELDLVRQVGRRDAPVVAGRRGQRHRRRRRRRRVARARQRQVHVVERRDRRVDVGRDGDRRAALLAAEDGDLGDAARDRAPRGTIENLKLVGDAPVGTTGRVLGGADIAQSQGGGRVGEPDGVGLSRVEHGAAVGRRERQESRGETGRRGERMQLRVRNAVGDRVHRHREGVSTRIVVLDLDAVQGEARVVGRIRAGREQLRPRLR